MNHGARRSLVLLVDRLWQIFHNRFCVGQSIAAMTPRSRFKTGKAISMTAPPPRS
jgi:hypothetical protein